MTYANAAEIMDEIANVTPTFAGVSFAKLDTLPMPSVAVINGYAFGGGMELALACTFRLATRNAKMGTPEIKLGLIPGYGGTQRLPRVVGEARALEMVMTGRTVDADEALRIGLVNHLVPHDELAVFARSLAVDVAATGAVSEVLRLYAKGDGLSLADALALEAEHTCRRGAFDAKAFGEAGKTTAARGSQLAKDS